MKWLWATLPVVALLGCSDNASDPTESNDLSDATLVIVGSSTMYPVVTAIAQRFEAANPGVNVRLESGGSARGIADTRSGAADIGMVSRVLKKDEERDLRGFPMARDGIAIITHTANPVSKLTTAQIRDIYTGKLQRWRDVGGNNAPIVSISREPRRSSLSLFLDHFGLKEADVKAKRIIDDNPQTFAAVADDPNAIAYISIGETERRIANGVPIKILAVDGVVGSTVNVRNGSYPILRPLVLVTKQSPQRSAKQFADFASSSSAKDIIEAHDFVPYHD